MQEIKKKLGYWLMNKIIKWLNIEPLDFYRMFSNQIYTKQISENKEHFGKFKYIKTLGIYKISDDISNVDKHTVLGETALEVPEWNKNNYENTNYENTWEGHN